MTLKTRSAHKEIILDQRVSVDQLPGIMRQYSTTYHTTITMKPKKVRLDVSKNHKKVRRKTRSIRKL